MLCTSGSFVYYLRMRLIYMRIIYVFTYASLHYVFLFCLRDMRGMCRVRGRGRRSVGDVDGAWAGECALLPQAHRPRRCCVLFGVVALIEATGVDNPKRGQVGGMAF